MQHNNNHFNIYTFTTQTGIDCHMASSKLLYLLLYLVKSKQHVTNVQFGVIIHDYMFKQHRFKCKQYIIYYNMDEMDEEECNICGRKCDGVHSDKIISKEKEIQKITKLLESYGEKMVDEVISQIYDNRRRLKCESSTHE